MLIDSKKCKHPIEARAPIARSPNSYKGDFGMLQYVSGFTGVICLMCGLKESAKEKR